MYFPKPYRHILLLSLLALQACSSSFEKTNNEMHQATNFRVKQSQVLARQTRESNPLVRDERTVRFTTRSIPLLRSAMLPPHIEQVTVRYPGRHSLSTIADILTRTLGVVVLMTPDALQDPLSFRPGGGAGGGPGPAAGPAAGPASAVGPGAGRTTGPQNAGASAPSGDQMDQVIEQSQLVGASRLNLDPARANNTFELNYSGPLSSLLDWIANQAQLQWSYEDDVIVFRRVVTQFFQIKTLPGSITASSSLSIAGGGPPAAGGGAEQGGDLWEALKGTLPLLISRNGQFLLDTRLGVVTVRDSIGNLKNVERYIDQVNKLFLRQVNIQVEIIQVDLNTEAQSGIDWANLSRTLTNGAVLRSSGPGFNAGSTTSGSIGIFKGETQALFKSLEKYGRVSNMYSAVVNTVHRQPVPLTVSNSRTYLRSVTSGNISTNGAVTGPTLSVADLNTGFSLNLLPAILDSNRVLLESNITISSIRELAQFSTGAGFGETVLQQPNIDNFQNVQRVTMGLGETVVLLGYEYEEARNSVTDVVREKIPGSRLNVGAKKTVIILLTPSLSGS
jgi:type IVB pilus formation R64 PilN family outer membrane protein